MILSPAVNIIHQACQIMNKEDSLYTPCIVNESDFDMRKFEARESEIEGLNIEYVNESMGEYPASIITKTRVWPIGGGWLFVWKCTVF